MPKSWFSGEPSWPAADRQVVIGRDPAGRRAVKRFGNALETRMTYDAVAGIGGSGRLATTTYGLAAAGNLLTDTLFGVGARDQRLHLQPRQPAENRHHRQHRHRR